VRDLPSRRIAALGFIDRLVIASHGRDGNTAECRIKFDQMTHPHETGELQLPADIDHATDEAADQLLLRTMTTHDVDGFIRLVYRCYGYSYPDSVMYVPKAIHHLLTSQTMRSVVAVTPTGEVVAHAALTTGTGQSRVPEAGRLVVDPRYRGHHLAERVTDLRQQVAVDVGFAGLWAECVTNHPASQRNVSRLGGVEMGLLIGAGPADVVMSSLSNDNQGRRTLLPMYSVVTQSPARTIHLPFEYVNTTSMLAGRLGLERTCVSNLLPGQGRSRMLVEVNPDVGTAHLRFDRIGSDASQRVATELGELVAFELGTVHVDVPLADPAAAWLINALERQGFCWATWVPEAEEAGDVLRLQRVGEHLVDVEHVQCATVHGEFMRDWVVAQWHRVNRPG